MRGESIPGLRYAPSDGRDEVDRDPHRDPRPALARAPRARVTRRSRSRCRCYLPVFVAEALERHDHGRRRQHLHRLRGRGRRLQRRPLPSARRRGDPGAGRAVRPHRFHGRPVRRRTSSSRSGWRALVPIAGPTRAAFFNSGAEAVENAVKIARLATGRPAVIAFEGGFHGRTMLAMTMTSKVHPYKTGMGPFAPEVYRAPFPNEYRGVSAAEALERDRADVRDARRAVAGRRDRLRAAARRGRLRPRAARVRARGCAASATARGSCWSRTRCRRASDAPGGCSRWSTTPSSRT